MKQNNENLLCLQIWFAKNCACDTTCYLFSNYLQTKQIAIESFIVCSSTKVESDASEYARRETLTGRDLRITLHFLSSFYCFLFLLLLLLNNVVQLYVNFKAAVTYATIQIMYIGCSNRNWWLQYRIRMMFFFCVYFRTLHRLRILFVMTKKKGI